MSIDYSLLKFGKPVRPEKRQKRLKRQSERAKREQPTLDAAKAKAWKRDRGQCRAKDVGARCVGQLDPCHLADWRRSLTRGQAAELRHPSNGRGIMVLCRFHHLALDQGRMTASYNLRRGANGPVMFEWNRR